MPLSKKRKTKNGKPVRYTPAPPHHDPPPRDWWDHVLGEPLPAFRVVPRDTVRSPVFVGENAYRCDGPARILGGTVRPHLRLAIGRGSLQRLPVEMAAAAAGPLLWSLMQAAHQGTPLVVVGLSETLTVLSADPFVGRIQAALMEGIRATGLPVWVGADDDWAVAESTSSGAATLRRGLEAQVGPDRTPAQEAAITLAVADFADGMAETFCDALAAADGVVVSTAPLAQTAQRANPRVVVIPNAIDPGRLAHTPHRHDGSLVRVGMSGTLLKWQDDLPLALPGLLAAGRQPGVELHTFGGRLDGMPATRSGRCTVAGVPSVVHPGMGYEAYQRAAGILDIAALPLRPDLAFNRARSGQKWMEMALHATACVVQRLEPYWQAEDEVTCLKAGSPEEWTAQVLRLVDDAPLRRRIGDAARAEVLANHTLEARRPLWEAGRLRRFLATGRARGRGRAPRPGGGGWAPARDHGEAHRGALAAGDRPGAGAGETGGATAIVASSRRRLLGMLSAERIAALTLGLRGGSTLAPWWPPARGWGRGRAPGPLCDVSATQVLDSPAFVFVRPEGRNRVRYGNVSKPRQDIRYAEQQHRWPTPTERW